MGRGQPAAVRPGRGLLQHVQVAQDMYTAAPWRDVDVAPVKPNQSALVSVPGHDVGCDACEFRSGLAFRLPAGADRDWGGLADRDPGGGFAFFQVLADE